MEYQLEFMYSYFDYSPQNGWSVVAVIARYLDKHLAHSNYHASFPYISATVSGVFAPRFFLTKVNIPKSQNIFGYGNIQL